MNKPEVERLARVYEGYRQSSAVQRQWSPANPGNRAILAERRRGVQRLLRQHARRPLAECTVLDVGCGSGHVLAGLRRWGARAERLHGVDLLPERVAAARDNYPELDFRCANAEALDFQDGALDLLLAFTVFSSILDEQMAHSVAREMARVLAPGGALLWYDFRYDNPRNPHVQGMTKEKIRRLFPGRQLNLQTITLLPPLARRLGPATPLLYPLLARIPPLRTHYLGILSKGRQTMDGRRRTKDDGR